MKKYKVIFESQEIEVEAEEESEAHYLAQQEVNPISIEEV